MGDELALQINQIQSISRNILISVQALNIDQLKFPFDLTIRKPIEFEELEETLMNWSREL